MLEGTPIHSGRQCPARGQPRRVKSGDIGLVGIFYEHRSIQTSRSRAAAAIAGSRTAEMFTYIQAPARRDRRNSL
jgi:hypothetical protein